MLSEATIRRHREALKYTGDFTRIPFALRKQVQEYIECLKAAQMKDPKEAA